MCFPEFCDPLQQIKQTQGWGALWNLWSVAGVRSTADNLDLQLTSEVGGQSCGTEPLTCEIQCYQWVDSVRFELILGCPSGVGELLVGVGKTYTHWVTRAVRSEVLGTSLAVRWFRLCASTAEGMGSIPGRGTKIPHATQCGQKLFF